jgi:N6-L-threonylcarbamoyladenine synthase
MRILAIESSCDETAAAVIENGTTIISNVVSTSKEMHEKYGGIVPEVAARMQLSYILPAITEALAPYNKQSNHSLLTLINEHIDAIAIAVGPGLIGSLLVGVETAKTIAMVTHKPIIPVNHVLAHMYANFININQHKTNNSETKQENLQIQFPAISLVVSGGHTELYLMHSPNKLVWLGGTLDDAAGECFDKTARLLGFGHGGGVSIQEAAGKFQPSDTLPNPIRLPRPMLDRDNELNFSFSGLKTAILREVNMCKTNNLFSEASIRYLSHEVQETITDVLVKKTLLAAHKHNAKSILLSGGVSANLRLREKFQTTLTHEHIDLYVPPVTLCTDNAVYIGAYAYFRGTPEPWNNINAVPNLSVEVLS